ncbi:MAG: metalloregulator ArsR/SmtB family transcription factor [Pseudomonadota bacterium]
MDINSALSAFDALSQQARLEAYRLLVRAGPAGMPAGEIATRLDVRQNTMSAHLAVMLHAGLVQRQREGRVIRYSVDIDAMRALLAFMLEDCCGGNPALCQPIIEEVACAC